MRNNVVVFCKFKSLKLENAGFSLEDLDIWYLESIYRLSFRGSNLPAKNINDDETYSSIGSTIFVVHGPLHWFPLLRIDSFNHPSINASIYQWVGNFSGGKWSADSGQEYGERITEAAGLLHAMSFLQKFRRIDKEVLWDRCRKQSFIPLRSNGCNRCDGAAQQAR